MTYAIVLVVVGFLSLSFIAFEAFNRPFTQSSTSTGTTPVYPVASVLMSQYLSDFNRLNASAIVQLYTNTSVVDWTGVTEPWAGRYYASDGSAFIRLRNFMQGTTSLNLTASNPSEIGFGPGRVNVTFTLTLRQSNVLTKTDNATVNVQQEWVMQSGVWLLQNDTWDYLIWSGETSHSM